ncbi:MAG: hypothetical protein ACRD2F_05045 [Terriglobales bacterium]
MTRSAALLLASFALLSMLCAAAVPTAPLPAPCPPNSPACVSARLQKPLRWKPHRVRLDWAIRVVAQRAGIPVSMLLLAPLPTVEIPSDVLSPAALLGRFAGFVPGYAWDLRGAVVRFYPTRLMRSPQNPLNWRLAEYMIRANPGGNRLWLGQALWNINLGEKPTPPIEGLLPELAGGPLPRVTLHNVTGGAILRRVLSATPSFTSQMTFPRLPPLSRADIESALASWQWIPLTRPVIPNLHPLCAPSPCTPITDQ